MKKNSFVQGAMIATIAIILVKILGVLYVIPFYAIIGEQGGALYGYAYTIYTLFLSISSIGLPSAMAKIISEYNTLEKYYLKEKAYKIGKKLMLITGFASFLMLFIFAPNIAYMILGDITGGNSIEDVTLVIRIISTAIIIVPLLSITRGYLQGHKYITPSSISQVLEQLIRVLIIIIGSYMVLNVFNLGLTNAVGIAVFGATAGAFVSYFYLVSKIKKNKIHQEYEMTRSEKRVTSKDILKKLVIYAIPFVMIHITHSFYNLIDMTTVVKTLVNGLKYEIDVAESVIGILNTWGYKLNAIVIAISSGLVTSLIPNITSNFVQKDFENVRRKVSQSLKLLTFITLPLTFGLSFLAKPLWFAFYGESVLGPTVFSYSIFIAFFITLFTITLMIMQSLNQYKMVFISLIAGLLIKLSFNIPLMYSFNHFGLHGFYGSITATIFGFIVSIIINLIVLKKITNISYNDTFKTFLNIVMGTLIMLIVLSMLKLLIPIDVTGRGMAVIVCFVYGIIGSGIYLALSKQNNTITSVLGNNITINMLKKSKKEV
ncbi:MAG: polysaccharide biosynthesis protein [Bacilli bacterium]